MLHLVLVKQASHDALQLQGGKPCAAPCAEVHACPFPQGFAGVACAREQARYVINTCTCSGTVACLGGLSGRRLITFVPQCGARSQERWVPAWRPVADHGHLSSASPSFGCRALHYSDMMMGCRACRAAKRPSRTPCRPWSSVREPGDPPERLGKPAAASKRRRAERGNREGGGGAGPGCIRVLARPGCCCGVLLADMCMQLSTWRVRHAARAAVSLRSCPHAQNTGG